MTCTRRTFLTAAACAALLPARAARATARRPDSLFRWRGSGPFFGGFSAIELTPNRRRATVISDRGFGLTLRLRRTDEGFIQSVEKLDHFQLRDSAGDILTGDSADAEGMARLPDGTLLVSFETPRNRIRAYADPHGAARDLPGMPEWRAYRPNQGLESLAVDTNGAIFTLPETPMDGAFPLYRFQGGWSTLAHIPRRGNFLPVALDFGPDGALYLLERAYRIAFFATRISRIVPGAWDQPQTLVETAMGDLDNHEGLSITRDARGQIWATTISDDNNRFLQRTEIAEFLLP